jgi:hypothetical protein
MKNSLIREGADLRAQNLNGVPEDEFPEKEISERMELGIRRFLNTPPALHGKNPTSPSPKHKGRPTPKGRAHKAKSQS